MTVITIRIEKDILERLRDVQRDYLKRTGKPISLNKAIRMSMKRG